MADQNTPPLDHPQKDTPKTKKAPKIPAKVKEAALGTAAKKNFERIYFNLDNPEQFYFRQSIAIAKFGIENIHVVANPNFDEDKPDPDKTFNPTGLPVVKKQGEKN